MRRNAGRVQTRTSFSWSRWQGAVRFANSAVGAPPLGQDWATRRLAGCCWRVPYARSTCVILPERSVWEARGPWKGADSQVPCCT